MSIETADNAFIERRIKHDRRVKASRSIRDARHKLASASGARPEFHYDLLYMCARNEIGAALATPFLAAIVAVASFYWTFSAGILIWLSSVFISEAILLMLCRKFLNENPSDVNLPEWRNWLTGAALLSGASWGAIIFAVNTHSAHAADIIVLATLIIILGIRTMFASTLLSFIYASTVPMSAALVAKFILIGPEINWVMAATTIGVHAYFIFLSRSLNNTVLSMLELRAEKDALIAEIEEAKAISDEARLRAESANRAKSRFLATMSHELRTPLNAILGFSEMLKSELFGPHSNPTYKEYAKDIYDSGEHLLKVINDILDISRIEADRYELKEEAVPLSGAVEDCIRLIRLRAENKGLHISEDIAEDLPKLWAEEKAIRQVILNLLSNAIKFTPKGGTITVEVGKTDEGGQFISVQDNGPGIPKDEIKKVLTPFGQGSLAHETAEGGTGLGLPIVKRLMEIHDGTFELESELRRGTRATATFPAKRSMQALPPLTEEKQSSVVAQSTKRPAASAARTASKASAVKKPVTASSDTATHAKSESKNLASTLADNSDLLGGEAARLKALQSSAAKASPSQLREEEDRRLEHLAYGQKRARKTEIVESSEPDTLKSDEPDAERQKLRELAKALREERMQEQADASQHSVVNDVLSDAPERKEAI